MDAEATAVLLEERGVMRVACLADGTAWALVDPALLQRLQACPGNRSRTCTVLSAHQSVLLSELLQVIAQAPLGLPLSSQLLVVYWSTPWLLLAESKPLAHAYSGRG